MKTVLSAGVRISVVAAVFVMCVGAPGRSEAQESDLCKRLNTPELIHREYFNVANYVETFRCLARMIEAGDYKSNTKVWNDYMFPVMDHYFRNKLDAKDDTKKQDFEALLWRIMIEPRDESGAAAVAAYRWNDKLKSKVTKSLEFFNEPASITLTPQKATLGKLQQAKFDVTYRNRADIRLDSLKPNLNAEVNPPDWGTSSVEGTKVMVTGLKAGEKKGTLTVQDGSRGLADDAELTFTGRMSLWWPVGGLAVTGTAVAVAASTDGGTSTTFWIIGGVSAGVTGILLYKYFRGEGAPLLSKSDQDDSDGGPVISLVPGPRSLELNVTF